MQIRNPYLEGNALITTRRFSDRALAFAEGTATIDDCEQPNGIAMDRLDGSGVGWVACAGNYSVVQVDLSSVASSYTPSTTLYMKASSGAAVATGGGNVYNGSYDAVGAGFDRPLGVAITPMLSITSPRPGVQVGGIRRFHVIVRDPSITAIEYKVNDGDTVCTDYELWDGSSECLIDTSEWTAGDNIVTVTAIGGTNGDFSLGATTSTWL